MRTSRLVAAAVVGALLPTVAMAASGIFRSAFTEISSSNATGIAVGDFDGDGTLDVATTNAGAGGNDLNVAIGFNDGTLSRVGQIPLGSFPSGLVIGTFDADTVADAVVAFANDNEIAFLKGLANFDFFAAPGLGVTVGQSPTGLAAVHLDGDGKLDLVVANEGGDSAPGSMSVLRGQGDGTFVLVLQDDPEEPGMTVESLPAELGTRVLAVGNVDADPALDVLALNTRSNSISIFVGSGGGFFAPGPVVPAGAAPHDLALIDLDGDAKLDIVTANANEDAVSVMRGNGDGTFGPRRTYPVGTAPTRLRVDDLDGDGELDVVASNSRSGDVSLLLGDGAGGFGPARTFVADAEPQQLALGDFNIDGRLDPVAATQGSDEGPSLALLRNRGAGILQGVEDVPAGNGPSSVAVADVDDDALPDLLVSGDGGVVSILSSRSDGFAAADTIVVGGRALGLIAVDLNRDARPDVVVADNETGRAIVIPNLGGGRFGTPESYLTAEGPANVTAGDFNGDGRPDLALSTIGSERFCLGGPDPGQACSQNSDCEPGGVCAAPGKASVLLQQVDGRFGTTQNTEVEETPLGIAAVDANCDGLDDLLVANNASNTVSVLRSNGDGTFETQQTLPDTQVGQGPIAIAVADFNRDGIADFAVSDSVVPPSAASVRVFKGHCDAPFEAVTGPGGQIKAGELVSAMVARDFTGDQIVDIGLINQTRNDVKVLRGLGDATFRIHAADSVSRMPVAITAGDFDGDGRYDGAAANNDPSANNISVLINCARDAGCDPFGVPGPPGTAALRGDANGDERRSAADLVAVGAEVMDGDGVAVEAIAMGSFEASAGADANGDGRVDPQDRTAVARRIFSGA